MRPVGGRPNIGLGAVFLPDGEKETVAVKEDTMVPCVWHGLPLKFFRELVEVSNAIGVIDFAPGDGLMALACLERKSPGCIGDVYCGCCHTENHADELRAHLTDRVFTRMQDEGNELSQHPCVAALSKKAAKRKADQLPKAGQLPKPKPKPRVDTPTPKPKPHADTP